MKNERDVLWTPWQDPGIEHLHLAIDEAGVRADGVIVGLSEGAPFRLRYEILCDPGWRARVVRLERLDADGSQLELEADGEGGWRRLDTGGERFEELAGCIDVDISVTPFTNTLAINRLRLEPGAFQELRMGYLEAPELRPAITHQRYTCLQRSSEGGLYRFEALESGFTADLSVDSDGLVLDYPGYFRRIWSR